MRVKIPPRKGEAQKALRRTYVTSSLIYAPNPREIAARLGPSTPRMVLTVYDSFRQVHHWPDDEELSAFARIYEWPDPAPAGERVQVQLG